MVVTAYLQNSNFRNSK